MKQKSNSMDRAAKITFVSGFTFFFLVGILPGLFIGSYGALILLSTYTERPVEACVLERIVILAGMGFGLIYPLILSVTGGLVSKYLIVSLIERIKKYLSIDQDRKANARVVIRHDLIDEEEKAGISSRIGFLDAFDEDVHSLMIVGSAAYDLRKEGSDIDVVVVCTSKGYERVRDAIFEREIVDALNSSIGKIEFTVLGPEMTEQQFRLASPFASSIRYGAVIKSDGYLEKLKERYTDIIPHRSYVFKALYEGIVTQYFGSITRLGRDIRIGHGAAGKCVRDKGCAGHGPAEKLSNVIMKMLYITLPSRGYIPLTKDDVATFTSKVYGKEAADAVEKVIQMMRNNVQVIDHDDFSQLRPLAAKLFRETLGIAGCKEDIVNILRDAAGIVRGKFNSIQDPAYRTCVIK